MATIDIKLKSYDELIFEITKLNTDKYLLEQENKQLKKRNKELEDGFKSATDELCEYATKLDKAIEYIKSYLPNYDFDHSNLEELLEILGDKEND